MNSIAEVRHHIGVVRDTGKITKAMYLISSAKMKKAMRMHDQNLIYLRRVRSGIRFIIESSNIKIRNPYYRQHGKKAGFLVIAGDKGLCGSYNSEVLKLARPKLSYGTPQDILWLARKDHDFSWARPVKISEESERSSLADQVENFLASELKAGRRYTQRQIEDGKHIDMPRAGFRMALSELQVSGRVINAPLPKDETSGARKAYLHPVCVPIAPEDDGAMDEKIDEKEAA